MEGFVCLRHVRRYLGIIRCYNQKRCYSENEISRILKKSLDEYQNICFAPYRMKSFTLGESFSNAGITIKQIVRNSDEEEVDPSTVNKKTDLYASTTNFKSIFPQGFSALERNALDGHMTQNAYINLAIQAFRTGFLQYKDFHEKCLQKMLMMEDVDGNEEMYVTALLTNHLFARLVANFDQHYFISTDYRSKDIYNKCPCEICGEKIIYRNSGIGNERLWYGYPDIMVFSKGGSCIIVRAQDMDRDEKIVRGDIYFNADFDEKQLMEEKKHIDLLRHTHNVSKFVAQCITFSFYQKRFQLKRGDSMPLVTLIPTVVFSGNYFDIYFYDCDNDILLRNKGAPIPLWTDDLPDAKLDMSLVLQLWMIFNHLQLRPSLPSEILEEIKGSFNFLNLLSPKHICQFNETVTMRRTFHPRHKKEIDTIPLRNKNAC